MALSTAQRKELVELTVGMFHAAPGSEFLSLLEQYADNGYGMEDLALLIAASPAYQTPTLYSPILSNAGFADRFVTNLIGDYAAPADCSALETLITDYLDAAGPTEIDRAKGEAIYLVVAALAAMPDTDATWGRAASHFANQVTVASYYSIDKGGHADSLAGLQSVVAPVTENGMSIALMFDAIDATVTASPTAPIPAPDLTQNQGIALYGSDAKGTLTGTSGNDVLLGGSGAESITGGGGTDYIDAGGGDDSLYGAQGSDVLNGGDGKDTLFLSADSVDNQLYNQPADLRLTGIENIEIDGDVRIVLLLTGQSEGFNIAVKGTASHIIVSGSGNDSISGGSANETLDGGNGNDTVAGGGGNDLITCDGGSDSISGGDGNDTLTGADATDTLDGGAGSDTLRFAPRPLADNSFSQPNDGQIVNIETIVLTGNSALHVDLTGQTEDFQVSLSGLSGHAFTSGSGDDSFLAVRGNDTLDGGAGTDTLSLTADNLQASEYRPLTDNALLHVENVTLNGTQAILLDLSSQSEAFAIRVADTANHTLTGGGGADTIEGGSGNESITGGNGADTIAGGGGSDAINLAESSPARDVLVYTADSDGGDRVTGFSAGSGQTSDQLHFDAALLNGIGSSSQDSIVVTRATTASTVFALNTTVVIVSYASVAAGADAATVASVLDSCGNNASYQSGDALFFVLNDSGGDALVYHFVSDAADDIVSGGELTLYATLTGVSVNDLAAGNFAAA